MQQPLLPSANTCSAILTLFAVYLLAKVHIGSSAFLLQIVSATDLQLCALHHVYPGSS